MISTLSTDLDEGFVNVTMLSFTEVCAPQVNMSTIQNSPFYPRVTYAIIERDVTAGVHSCAMLGYFTIVTYEHSQCKRAHAAIALYRVTYFSEYA